MRLAWCRRALLDLLRRWGIYAAVAAVLVGAGIFAGSKLTPAGADHVTVRVIDDGAVGGPKVISTQAVPLR